MSYILNFHGIDAPKRPFEENEAPYWISQDQFIAILDVTQSCDVPVHITFDDGNDSDALIAAPILSDRGIRAEFFILAGKVGKKGYVNETQVQQLDNHPLFSIGSHGMDHMAWPDGDDDRLSHEIIASQKRLSDICGRPIDRAGLPFGRYDRRVIKALKKTGYRMIYSSDGGPKISSNLPIPRFSVRNDTDIDGLADTINASMEMTLRIKNEAKVAIKAML